MDIGREVTRKKYKFLRKTFGNSHFIPKFAASVKEWNISSRTATVTR